MNAPEALHLYDLTHGQRRLSLWRSVEPVTGRALLHVAVAVPLTLQAPGEAPEVEWEQVAHVATEAIAAQLCQLHRNDGGRWPDRWQLALGFTTFQLLAIEADSIADYLGLAIDTVEDAV